MPSKAEMEEGRRNLAEHNNGVDFIVTHCCSSGTQACLGGGMFTSDDLTKYFQELRETHIQCEKWHRSDKMIGALETCYINEDIISNYEWCKVKLHGKWYHVDPTNVSYPWSIPSGIIGKSDYT